jgi:hypothetical protein
MSIKPTFQGEVQFRRWSDSSTQGVQITFALPDSSDLEPLKAKAGKRFMAVLVEIGDDEQPVQEPERAKVGPLCREAVGLCQMPEFHRWVSECGGGSVVPSAQNARSAILEMCGVGSRKELDASAYAGNLFVNDIRIPFMKYMKTRKSSEAAALSAAQP